MTKFKGAITLLKRGQKREKNHRIPAGYNAFGVFRCVRNHTLCKLYVIKRHKLKHVKLYFFEHDYHHYNFNEHLVYYVEHKALDRL